MTDNPNIEDVTNSPKDWEDFWNSPEKYGTWEVQPDEEQEVAELMKPRRNSYIDDVLSGKNNICKRESPLSE